MLDNYNYDYVKELEEEIKDIDNLIEICKENNYSQNIIFILTALSVKKKDKLLNIIK